jgi:hypothetical protein
MGRLRCAHLLFKNSQLGGERKEKIRWGRGQRSSAQPKWWGTFLIVPNHIAWSMVSHSSRKEKMGMGRQQRGLRVREGRIGEKVVSF